MIIDFLDLLGVGATKAIFLSNTPDGVNCQEAGCLEDINNPHLGCAG